MEAIEYLLFRPRELFNVEKIAEAVLKQGNIKALMELVFCNDIKLSNRALWVMSHCSNIEPKSIMPYYEKLIIKLNEKKLTDAFKRNTLHLFSENEIPKKYQAFMLDICYQYLHNTTESIAVRALSIPIIYTLSAPYPELIHELQLELHHILSQENPPALLAKARIYLKKLERLREKQK